jgi:uncharacterized protein YodC (DUF2158 family)
MIQPGDAIELNGFPPMTVQAITPEGRVLCSWFDGQGVRQVQVFDLETLTTAGAMSNFGDLGEVARRGKVSEFSPPTTPAELTPPGRRSGSGVASILEYLGRSLLSKPKAEPPSSLSSRNDGPKPRR